MEAKTIQKYSKLSTAKLKAKAVKIFNAWIRNRDKGNRCISCGSGIPEHAGHFYSAGHHNGLRFDSDNCHLQCVRCNYFLSGNLLNYRRGLIQKIGLERLTNLDMKAKMKGAVKDDRFLLIDIILKYSQNLNGKASNGANSKKDG